MSSDESDTSSDESDLPWDDDRSSWECSLDEEEEEEDNPRGGESNDDAHMLSLVNQERSSSRLDSVRSRYTWVWYLFFRVWRKF